MHKIPQDIRERQLRELAEADGYSFVGWVDGCKNAHSKAILRCVKHGEWCASITSFVHSNKRCKICSNISAGTLREIPQIEREKQLTGLAEVDGYTFAGWVDGYNGVHSRAVITCHIHGGWESTVNNFVNNSRRCPGCAGVKTIPQGIRERQLIELAVTDGYAFIRWANAYKNRNTKAVMSCVTHGEWEVTSKNFITLGHRCPSCRATGYTPNKPATLYALLSDCETMIKIGISNVPEQRHIILTRKTPFDFTTHRQLHCEDGSQPPMLERMFHDAFPSANLRGFDGATEWRHMSPDVTTWLDLLGAQ
jgi:hypothetical protein